VPLSLAQKLIAIILVIKNPIARMLKWLVVDQCKPKDVLQRRPGAHDPSVDSTNSLPEPEYIEALKNLSAEQKKELRVQYYENPTRYTRSVMGYASVPNVVSLTELAKYGSLSFPFVVSRLLRRLS
jgi:hypothetical protein